MPYNPYMGFWANASNSFTAYSADVSGATVDEILGEKTFSYTLEKDYCVYKTGAGARDVEYIKKQLDSGVKNIPVGYFIEADYWSEHKGYSILKMNPDDLLRFNINGKAMTYAEAKQANYNLEEDVQNSKVEIILQNGYKNPYSSGHAVSIVGYDKTGFIIKNSWGKDWANNGYGWLSFDYHKLLVRRILILKHGRIKIANNADRGNDVKASELYLKSMPSGKNEKGLLVSLVYRGSKAPPSFKKITYKVHSRFNSKPIEIKDGISIYSSLLFEPREYGYQAELLGKELLLDFIYGYYIVAEMELENGRKITNMYYHVVPRNKEYEPNQY
jgi:Papain family cysteine protease